MITANQMSNAQKQTIQNAFDNIVSSFFDSVAIANFEARHFADTFNKVYEAEKKIYELLKVHPLKIPTKIRCINLYAMSLRNNKHESFLVSGGICRDEGFVEAIRWSFNDNICWHLVNIYETFENAIKDLFMLIGYVDPNVWRPKDYCKFSPDEKMEKELDSYIGIAKKLISNQSCSDILNRLRQYFRDLERVEKTNSMKLNLKVAIVLIEHMRHVIVHKRGKVSLTKFINSVCVKSGISIKTVKAAGMWKEIESFFVCHGCDGGHKLLLADLEGHNCPCQTVS